VCSLAPDEWLNGRLHHPSHDLETVRKAAARSGCELPRRLENRFRSGQPPHIHDVLTFTATTGIPLYQSFLIFGHDLEDLPLLQAVLHRSRTVILPTTVYDNERQIDWPAPLADREEPRRGEFLSELTRFECHRVSLADATCAPSSLYVRTGHDDTNLVPVLLPGTVVQVDTTDRGPGSSGSGRPIYAVADRRGVTCTYVDWLDDRSIVLVPHRHAVRPVIRRLEDEVVVLGRVCAELRPMCVRSESSAVAGHDHRPSRLVRPDPERQTFGRFLRSAREAIGMTHREAHELSATVARAYDDQRFAIGVGTLSDWESQNELPLHVPHLFSLAACYAVSIGNLLRAARVVDADPFSISSLTALIHAARMAAGVPNLTWDDVFRCGDRDTVLDRSLVGARYLIVNRRDRRIEHATDTRTVDRPLYILSDSQGRHVCSACFTEGRRIYLQPDPQLPMKVRALPRARISVRGRVVAAFRKIEQFQTNVRTRQVAPRP
jgi:hypothetical protein